MDKVRIIVVSVRVAQRRQNDDGDMGWWRRHY